MNRKTLYIWFILFAILDVLTTWRFLKYGIEEGNFLFALFVQNNTLLVLFIPKIIQFAILYFVIENFKGFVKKNEQPKYDRVMNRALVGANAVMFLVVVWNYLVVFL